MLQPVPASLPIAHNEVRKFHTITMYFFRELHFDRYLSRMVQARHQSFQSLLLVNETFGSKQAAIQVQLLK